jgi:hypothetical protein
MTRKEAIVECILNGKRVRPEEWDAWLEFDERNGIFLVYPQGSRQLLRDITFLFQCPKEGWIVEDPPKDPEQILQEAVKEAIEWLKHGHLVSARQTLQSALDEYAQVKQQ